MSNISVRQLCLEYLNSKDEGSDRFRRLYRIATLAGVRKFNIDIQGRFITQLLAVTPNGTVPFPPDYLDYSMVGVINDQGEAVPLYHNESLTPVKQAFIAGLGIVKTPVDGLGDFVYGPNVAPFLWFNYWWDGAYVNLYGVGGGTGHPGEFKVDENSRCFLIGHHFRYQQVLVEYLSNGYNDADCNYYIHTFCADAFTAWLRWQDNIDKKGVSQATIRNLKREFGIEQLLAKVRMNPVRISEAQNITRRNVKLVAKA